MAVGDAAAAAGIPLVDGATVQARDLDTEINRTLDEVATRTAGKANVGHKHSAADITSGVLPVGRGGTGRTNIGDSTRGNVGTDGYGLVAVRESDGALFRAVGQLASGYLGNQGLPSGGTFTSNVYFPNAVAATSGYTVAYLNSDGRLSRGASSERYKEGIVGLNPADLGDIFPALYSFRMKGSDTPRVGWIAERLDEHPDQQPFVVYARDVEYDDDGEVTGARLAVDESGRPIPESIDFIALLIAQNAQLHQQLDLLAQRLAHLEDAS